MTHKQMDMAAVTSTTERATKVLGAVAKARGLPMWDNRRVAMLKAAQDELAELERALEAELERCEDAQARKRDHEKRMESASSAARGVADGINRKLGWRR